MMTQSDVGGYRLRPEQCDLLERMANHMDHSCHAPLTVQEAATGIGKTIVELLIAYAFALERKRTEINGDDDTV